MNFYTLQYLILRAIKSKFSSGNISINNINDSQAETSCLFYSKNPINVKPDLKQLAQSIIAILRNSGKNVPQPEVLIKNNSVGLTRNISLIIDNYDKIDFENNQYIVRISISANGLEDEAFAEGIAYCISGVISISAVEF